MSGEVSVIIPARSREPFLGVAIDSVLIQGERVAEILVCTDDPASPSAHQARREDPRVRLVVSPGPDLHQKLNAGLAHARLAWLAFLDADDVWPAGRVSAALLALDRTRGLEMCQGHQHAMTHDGHLVGASEPAPLLGTTIIRRDVALAVGPFRPGPATAMDWLLRARRQAHHAMLGDVQLHRRIHAGNLTRRHRAGLHAAYLSLARDAVRDHRRRGEPS